MNIKNIEGLPDAKAKAAIEALNTKIFGRGMDPAELAQKHRLLFTVAMDGDTCVGYKIGYEEKPGRFYSWLGGVDEVARGQGIATKLMNAQHDWCREQGYKIIQTKTKNTWRNMLVLNIKNGFDVIGCYTDSHGEPKIILEKKLI